MKASEIRELNDADLTARIAELEEERFRLRFRGATEQLEDPLRQRTIRRDIARLKTIQAERKAQGGGTATKSATTSAAKKGAKSAGTTKAAAARKAPAKKKAATGAGR
jgi:large subunit ribosomal protein L29